MAERELPDLVGLQLPFEEDDIEWRVQTCGKKRDGNPYARVLAYVDNRAIMDRLDFCCSPENWRNEKPEPGPDGGVIQGISIRIAGEWITKWDGAENTEIEKVKGGLSAAMKRAAVQWGIGRYLYNLDVAFAIVSDGAKHYAKTKEGLVFHWNPPKLPAWALPGGEGKPGAKPAESNGKPQEEDDVEDSQITAAGLSDFVDAISQANTEEVLTAIGAEIKNSGLPEAQITILRATWEKKKKVLSTAA